MPTAPVCKGAAAAVELLEPPVGPETPAEVPPVPSTAAEVDVATPVDTEPEVGLDPDTAAKMAEIFWTLGYSYEPFVIAGDGTYHRTIVIEQLAKISSSWVSLSYRSK